MGRFVGPPLDGMLIALGIVVPFGFNTVILTMTIGIVWLILRLAVMAGAINTVAACGLAILVLYTQEVLHLTATGYGVLLSCGAAGGVLSGLLLPPVARRIGMRTSLVMALATFVVLHLMLGLFSSTALAGLSLFLEAADGMLWNIVTVSYRQRLIPDDLLGRVNAVYRFFSWGAGYLVSVLDRAVGRAPSLHGPTCSALSSPPSC